MCWSGWRYRGRQWSSSWKPSSERTWVYSGRWARHFRCCSVASVLGVIEGTLNRVACTGRSKSVPPGARFFGPRVFHTALVVGWRRGDVITAYRPLDARRGEPAHCRRIRSVRTCLGPRAVEHHGSRVAVCVLAKREPAWRPILLRAVIGGGLWQVAQSISLTLQIGVARYSALYGAFAQVPITLAWFYASWVLLLFGAEIAAVVEAGPRTDSNQRWSRSVVALQVPASAWRAFGSGESVSEAVWPRAYRVPLDDAREMFRTLAAWSWLRRVDSESQESYVLGRYPIDLDYHRLAELSRTQFAGQLDANVSS